MEQLLFAIGIACGLVGIFVGLTGAIGMIIDRRKSKNEKDIEG